MAITNAQQYKQLLANGGSTNDISLEEAKDMAPKGEFLAYINKKEAKMLKDAGGSGIITNAGIPSFRPQDYGQEAASKKAGFDQSDTSNPYSKASQDANKALNDRFRGGNNNVDEVALTGGNKTKPKITITKDENKFNIPDFKTAAKKGINFFKKSYYNRFPNNPEMEFRFINQMSEEEYDDLPQSLKDAFEKTKTSPAIKSGKTYKDFDKLSFEDFDVLANNPDFQKYAKDRGSPGLSVSGNMSLLGDKFVKKDPITGKTLRDPLTGQVLYGYGPVRDGRGNDSMSDYERRLLELEQAVAATPETTPVEEDQIINYRLMADGGRAEFKDGEGIMQMASAPDPMDERNSMMETIAMEEFGKPLSDLTDDEIIQIELFMEEMSKRKDEPRVMAQQGGRIGLMEGGMPYEGGIMDLESSRQMYGLGKLVKKITRGVKKIAKSPIGKAALAFGAYKLGGAFLKNKGIMGSIFGQAGSRVGQPFVPFKEGFLPSLGLTKGGGSMMPTFLGGIAATTLGSYFMTPKEEDDNEELYAGADLPNPVEYYLSGQYTPNRRLAAEGGSMDEPVAKKTMPLLDMDGQEMDLRAEGGFVPLGRMERADDVPARLSKNEFVFTADAVRNAGEGDVDKGAEVMYNMMKNLESGGEVSEESQGLEGAREMFQTSQRLEEVI